MKNLVFFVVAVAILGTSLAANNTTVATTTTVATDTTTEAKNVTPKPTEAPHNETIHGKYTLNTPCSSKTSCKDCFATKEDGCHFMFILFEHGVHSLCIEKNTTLSDLEERLFKNDTDTPKPYKTILDPGHCPSCGKHDSSCEHCLAEPDLDCFFVQDAKDATKSSCIEQGSNSTKPSDGQLIHHGDACPTPKKDQPKPTTPPAPHPKTSGGFDGSSFFGGIILTVALPTVAFVGYKFYQRRQRGGTHQPF